MTRYPDWHQRLRVYLAEAGRAGFAEGTHDCALFAAGAVLAMTGTDLAAGWRGRYRSTRGGLRVLRRAGYRDHIDLVARHLDAVAPAVARPGDLAVISGPAGPVLGLVQGEGIYVLTPAGLGLVPRAAATGAFRV